MKPTVFFGPFVGELGWEMLFWQGLVRKMSRGHFRDHDRIAAIFHHPSALLLQYRSACASRKPRPGLLLQAAVDFDLDLHTSVMVGERLSDIAAGVQAGCRTVVVAMPATQAPLIESPDHFADAVPDARVACIAGAVDWVLGS